MTTTDSIKNAPELRNGTPHVVGSPEAVALIDQLKQKYGPVMFHQSGGCCDGSVPLCFRRGDFRVSAQDVLLGEIDGTPFYVGVSQYKYLSKTPLHLDIVPGDIDSFYLEAGSGVRFITRVNGVCCNIPRA
jgi:uncharacterized protein